MRPRRLLVLLAGIAAIATLSACAPSEARMSGTVIDSGKGPEFCQIVLESHPPQCGDGVALQGWDWDAVEHEEASGVRFGEYRFLGVRDGDSIRVTRVEK